MTVQYSIQKMVSDGTLSTIVLGIQYLQRNDIYIRIAGEETPQSGAISGYTWSFVDNTTLKILPVVPNGVEVVVYRRTDVDAMYNIYSQNAQFDEASIDENNEQLLYIAQEYFEQGIPGAGVATVELVREDNNLLYYRINLTDGSYTPEFTIPRVTAFVPNPASFTFVTGGVLNTGDEGKAVLWPISGGGDEQYYVWKGVYPKVVPAMSSPASTGGVSSSSWLPVGDITLRDDLASSGNVQGDALLAVKQPFPNSLLRTQHLKNAERITTDDASSLADIFSSGARRVVGLGKSYTISSPLTIPAGCLLEAEPGFGISGAAVTNNGAPMARALYSATVPYSVGTIVIASNGNEYICTSAAFGASPSTAIGNWAPVVINYPITIAVPSVFPNINAALAYISAAKIHATVTIACASHSSPEILFNNHYGDKIIIDGGSRSTTINFGTNEGFRVDGPFELQLRNMTITGTNWSSHGIWTKVTNGVFAGGGGTARGTNVFITKMYYGFQAGRGGNIRAENCEASEAGDGGFFAFNGGHIEAISCSSHDNYDSGFLGGELGFGFVAEGGASMWLQNPVAFGSVGGIFANVGSSFVVNGVNIHDNGVGVSVKAGGVVEINGGTVSTNISDNVSIVNGRYSASNVNHNSSQNGSGIRAASGAVARLNGCSVSNNKLYGVFASLASVVDTSSTTTATGNLAGAYFPALGVIGNNNSIIANS